VLTTIVSVPGADRRSAYDRVTRALEWPMAICASAVIPALLLDNGNATPRIHELALFTNWFVWIAFCGEFTLRLILATDRKEFMRRAWLDLLIIFISPPFGVPEGLQAVRAVRAVRVLRLLRVVRAAGVLSIGLRASRRALQHRKFHYVLLTTAGIVLLGATGMYLIEGDQNPSVKSFWDALWWAVTTTTTVGYGDVYPQTEEGRLIAVVLMVVGIGVIGIFTATVASFFINAGENEMVAMKQQLEEIGAKLDRLLAEREKTVNPSSALLRALSEEDEPG
jgi:voltage-gated potassium channel